MNKREKFEAWSRNFYGDLACASDTWSDEKGAYMDFAHHMAWSLWCALQSRLESLEKDASRYRWLRNETDLVASWDSRIALAGFAKTEKHRSELDATIDTAMQANKGM